MKATRVTISLLALAIGTSTFAPAQYGPPQDNQRRAQDQDRDHDHDHGGWDAPPSEYREAQRKGFHDGIEGARRDVENHRRPNVNNRDEYRHPPVSGRDRRDYRDAFRRGYDVAMSHLAGTGPR